MGRGKLVALATTMAITFGMAGTAHAGLLGSITKTVTQVTTTTTTALAPVTSVAQPVTTTTTTTTATTSQSTPLGQVVADTTTVLDAAVDDVLSGVVPDPDPLNVVPAGYDPITPLANLLAGTQGLPSALQQITCPPATEIAELLNAVGFSAVADGLVSLACISGLLEYKFFTRFKRADGTMLEREHTATLALPQPLDVDEDPLPDLIGTISLTGLDTVGLVVDRFPGETAPLPVSVEAVLRDPTGGALGREHIGFGFDARDDRAPGQFVVATPITTITAPSPNFKLNISQREPGQRVALIGGIFDGTLTERLNPAEVRLDWHRSPDTAGVDARVGDDQTFARLTTNKPGPAELTGRIVENSDEQRFGATFGDLPAVFEVDANQADGLSATITSSAPIARLGGSFERLRNIGPSPVVLAKTRLDVEDLPVGVAVDVGDDTGSVATTGGPIGHLRFGQANGEPVFLADAERAYVNISDDGTVQSVAAAIPGLSNATFSLGAAPQISAQMQSTPFKVRLTEPGRSLRADVLDLPSRFAIGLDLEGGVLSYDGFGSGIDRITLAGDGALFGRATKLRGSIEGIPAAMTAVLDLGDTGGGEVRVDGGGAIEKVEIVASNGSEELPAGSGQGVVFRDVTGGDYVVAARIIGLRRIAFTGGDQIGVDTHTAGGPFSVVAQTDDLTADGLIADLPAKAALTAALGAGRVTFEGKTADDQPAGIAALDLDVVGTGPLFGRADRLDLHVEDIPASVALDVAQGGEGADITASNPIGLIELIAANRAPQADDLPAGGEQGAKFTDLTGGEFVVGARIRELKRLSAQLGTPMTIATETAGGPFGVRVTTDDLAGHLRIEDLPAKLTAGVDLDAGKLTVTSRTADDQPQTIGRITLDLAGDAGLFGRADRVAAKIEGIPSDLVLDIAQSGSGARIAGSAPIELIELVAANRPAQPDDLPLNDEQGVKLTDLAGGDFVIGARIRDLQLIDGSFTGDNVNLATITRGGPFGVRVTTDDLSGLARIEDLPAKLTVGLDLAAGKLQVSGRTADDQPQGIDRIHLALSGDQGLFGRATDVDALIEGIPADILMDLAQAGSGVNLTASEPIDKIELVARAGDIADPQTHLPPAGEQGARYIDRPDEFLIGVRVLELEQLTANLAGDINLRAKTAGGPFTAIVDAGGILVDAALRDLPRDVLVSFAAADGAFHYEGKDGSGNPVGIDLIELDIASDAPLFGRADRVSVRIDDMAPVADVVFDPDAAAGLTANVTASEPIGEIRMLASEGDAAFPGTLTAAGNTQGAVLTDLPAQPFLAAVRLVQLRSLAIGFAGDDIGINAKTAGGPFLVDVDTEDFGIDGQILDLPADASLDVNLADGQIVFTGKDAAGDPEGIDLLTLDGKLGTPVLGRANRISARIEKLPPTVTLGFSQTNGKASLNASQPIQLIELFGWQDGEPKPVFAADQGARLHDRAGQPFQLVARVKQLKKLEVDFAQAVHLTTETAGGLFEADIKTETLDADAVIDQLPTLLDLNLDLDTGQVVYSGSSTINRIFAAVESAEPTFLGAKAFEAQFLEVPTSFTLGIGQETDNISLVANNPIGQIDVRARSANRVFPTIPAGEAGAVMDSTNNELALALRVFALKKLEVQLDPVVLDAEMQGGRKFTVDAKIQNDDGSVLDLDGVVDQLPSKVRLGLEDNIVGGVPNGTKLALNGSAPIGFVRLAVQGLELLPGADKVEAEINDLPQNLTVTLPETGTLALIEARNAANALTPIGQIRMAASNGSKTLPAFVSDAQYNANPGNTGFRDRLEFNNSPGQFGVALRLTAPKSIAVDLDPIALTLEQDGARTRPIAIAASIPNSTAGQPATTIDGVFNKPSSRTVIGVNVSANQPTRLNFENAAPVGSLSLNAANLGTIPTANFSLANIPTKLAVCFVANSGCRRADRLPAALSDYGGSHRSPSQSATAGGGNRPYAAQVSMDFDDDGTSGTSSNVSTMTTLNASVKLTASAAPITITNVRFHELSLDLGEHPTNKTFSATSTLGQQVPRIYLYLDSVAKPFVMNSIKYPPTIEEFKIGTDGSPANGNRRLVWMPGSYCSLGGPFGSCITTGMDQRANGSLSCGGDRALTIKVLGINFNILDFLGLQLLPVCS